MNRLTLTATLLLAPLLLATPRAAAQPTTEDAPAETTTVVYPISDLIEPVPDFPDTDGMGPPNRPPAVSTTYGGGGGLYGGLTRDQPDQKQGLSRDEVVDIIVQALQSIVDRDSWTDNGGIIGSVKLLNGKLFITQTPENQKRVEAFLRDLRSRTPTVEVEAAWPTLAAADLDAANATDKLDQLVRTLAPSTPRARIACRDGQSVHLASGPSSTIVLDLTPIVGQNAVGWDPTVSLVQTGGFLQLRPVLRTIVEGEPPTSAVLTVRSVLSRFDAPPEQLPGPFLAATPATNPAEPYFTAPLGEIPGGIDRLKTSVARLTTSLVVPLNHWTFVGGMTPDAGASKPDATQVYLLVRITVPKIEKSAPK